jgi:hypothetical protein
MSAAQVIWLDDRRSQYQPAHDRPVSPPMLRLVGADEPASAQVFTLEVFLARARVVMTAADSDLAS